MKKKPFGADICAKAVNTKGKKRGEQMDNKYANQCIACTVSSCKHHNDKKDFCSLEKITIGIHNKRPAEYPCTDCRSFQLKSDYDMGEC